MPYFHIKYLAFFMKTLVLKKAICLVIIFKQVKTEHHFINSSRPDYPVVIDPVISVFSNNFLYEMVNFLKTFCVLSMSYS